MSAYLNLFENRRNSPEIHQEWLDASMETLCQYHEFCGGNIEKAAAFLANSRDFKTLRALAYASYCFWSQPLQAYDRACGDGETLKPQTSMPWAVNKVLYNVFKNAKHQPENIILMHTYGRLFYATIAFNAATAAAGKGYCEFQNELIRCVMSDLVRDPEYRAATRAWPAMFDDKNKYLPSAVQQVVGKDGTETSMLTEAYTNRLLRLDIKRLAEKAGDLYLRKAAILRPDLLPFVPKVEISLFNLSQNHGAYSFGKYISTFFCNQKGIYSFGSLANLIMHSLHETEHFLQYLFADSIKRVDESDPLYPAVQLFADNVVAQKKSNPDGAVSIYAAGPWACSPLVDAYAARPMEYYAFRLDNLGYNLADAWGGKFHAFDNPKHADVSKIGREVASRLRIQEAAKLTRT